MITRNTYTQGKGELEWDTWPVRLIHKLSLQSENETNDPLKSGPALAGPAGPATPPLLLEENEKGSVHGLVGQVSPMTVGKTGKGYFHALLTDGDQDVRIVGFGKSQRNILKDFEEKGDPVALKGCRIKRSRYTTDMEVILRPETNLTLFPKKIKVDPDRFAVKDSDINVNDIDSMARFKRVSLYAKVIRVDEAAVVSDGLKVQNVIIADANRAIKMALWEDDIGRLSKGKSYHLVNEVVNSFQGANFLQFPKGGAEAHEVEDIGTVAEDDVPSLEDEVHNSEVAGILALDCYVACLSCKSKVDKKVHGQDVVWCRSFSNAQIRREPDWYSHFQEVDMPM